MKNKTLIYIIGAGRSGTTLLDIVLGNNENTISLGEINRYYKRNGIPPKRNENDKTGHPRFIFDIQFRTICTTTRRFNNEFI